MVGNIIERFVALTARLFWIVAGLIIAIVFMMELNDKSVIIEEISVPTELADRGYTPSVIAHQMLNEWSLVDETATTTKRRREVGLSRGQVDLPIGGFNLSTNAVVDYFKMRLGIPRERLRGGVVVSNSAAPECVDGCYTMFLHLDGGTPTSFSLTRPRAEIDQLIRAAARRMVEDIDPYLLANFYFASPSELEPNRDEEARRLIEIVLATPPRDDDQWAWTLSGAIHNRAERYAEAIPHFDRALALDASFAPALNSRCWAIGHVPGRAAEAVTQCREALRLDPDSYETMDSLAYALEQAGDHEQAFRVILCARRLSNGDPDIETTYTRLRAALPNADASAPTEEACAALLR